MNREDMTMEQEIEFVNQCFDSYEKEGFSKVFVSPYDFDEEIGNRQGASFQVIGRTKMRTETDNGEGTADLECLPLWQIQFEDGKVITAYAEEIIPSEIKESIWRESDKQFLQLI